MANAPQIPPPPDPITMRGHKISRTWWRWLQMLGRTTDEIIIDAGTAASTQGLFEGEIADLQARVKALEGRTQLFPDQPASKTEVRQLVDGLRQAIEAVERLMPPPNPGIFGTLTISNNGGLVFQGQTSDAGVATATMTNAPHAANPIFWVLAVINGTQVAIPAWAA
ncbi:MAG TPA: hypothetical protein VGR45_15100 [Stellaceae bacterium]|nr:hypothetical protein [Stellaceae bacterium]